MFIRGRTAKTARARAAKVRSVKSATPSPGKLFLPMFNTFPTRKTSLAKFYLKSDSLCVLRRSKELNKNWVFLVTLTSLQDYKRKFKAVQ